jgi:tetratricopeptide (TPR) repeat protein
MKALEGPIQPHVASAYTLAAVPARIVLERQRWPEAAQLAPRTPASFPWGRFPAMEAISHYARALGAARSGQPSLARAELEVLARLEQAAAEGSPYWGKQVRIMRESARAWLTYADGDRALARRQMQAAADLEATTEKHAVTTGEILPAQELLGDMLLAMERNREALDAYGKALERSPRRLNSLIGAARAAERLGEEEISRAYSRQLLESVNPDSPHPAIVHARQRSIPLPR